MTPVTEGDYAYGWSHVEQEPYIRLCTGCAPRGVVPHDCKLRYNRLASCRCPDCGHGAPEPTVYDWDAFVEEIRGWNG